MVGTGWLVVVVVVVVVARSSADRFDHQIEGDDHRSTSLIHIEDRSMVPMLTCLAPSTTTTTTTTTTRSGAYRCGTS